MTMAQRAGIFIVSTIMAGFLVLSVRPAFPSDAAEGNRCDIQQGPCNARTVGGLSVSFDIQPKPVSAMSKNVFTVVLSHNGVPVTDAAVRIALSMPGMYMGKNEIALAPRNKIYEGSGTIVSCPSGKKTWQADVVITASGKTSRTAFLFEVK